MGLFSAVINIFTTVHVGEDTSYVYVCFCKYNRDEPHFLRGGAHIGAFLGLATIQSLARLAYMTGALHNTVLRALLFVTYRVGVSRCVVGRVPARFPQVGCRSGRGSLWFAACRSACLLATVASSP
jgi:hypothetical protein